MVERKEIIMMRKRAVFCGLAVLTMLVLPETVCKAGTVIDQDMIDQWGKETGSVLFYSKKRLRIDQKDGKLSTIMDFKKDRIVILDHVSKSYIEYPFSTWEELVSQQIGTQKERKKREIRVESTGAEKEINGFKTIQINVFMDDFLTQDNWVTKDVDLDDMLRTLKQSVDRLSGISEAEREENEEIYQNVKKWGFPILTTEYRRFSGETLKEVTEIKSIETRKLGNDIFTPPKQYRKREQ